MPYVNESDIVNLEKTVEKVLIEFKRIKTLNSELIDQLKEIIEAIETDNNLIMPYDDELPRYRHLIDCGRQIILKAQGGEQ